MGVRTREIELAAGSEFYEFEVLERLGSGVTGTTYRVRRPEVDRTEALKLLPPRYAVDRALRERLAAEALHPVLAAHPAVLNVYEIAEAEGHLYVAMRYVEHGDLRRLVAGGGLAPALAAELTGQLASALDAAHGEGIVHGGVSAANVLVDGRWAQLGDFGLDRDGAAEDPRVDVRALGRLLSEMLTGRPFPDRRGLPPAFARVIDDALSEQPGVRHETAGELAAAALGAAALTAAHATRASVPLAGRTVHRPPRRQAERLRFDLQTAPKAPPLWHRALAIAALAGVIVLGAVLVAAGAGGPAKRAAAARHPPARNHRALAARHPARGHSRSPTPARAPSPASPGPAAPAWPGYAAAGFGLSYPAGWRVVENDVALAGGRFTETRFVNAAGTAEIDVDRSPGDGRTPRQAALSVRAATARTPGYHQLAFGPVALAGAPAWEWRFLARPGGLITLPGPRTDVFREIGGTRYATLGVGTGVRGLTAVTRRVAASIHAG